MVILLRITDSNLRPKYMNIGELLNKITDAILHLDFKKLLGGLKPIAVIIALISMVVIIIGAIFSLVPQF